MAVSATGGDDERYKDDTDDHDDLETRSEKSQVSNSYSSLKFPRVPDASWF